MTNREIAAVLFNISALLSRQHGNPYRIRAYRRAARNLLRLRHSVAERAAAGRPLGVPQLGERLTKTITMLATTGRLPLYEELCATLPPQQQTLIRAPGIGPTLAARIHRDLGAFDAEGLRHAAANGALTCVWGIGPRRSAAILAALGEPVARQEPLGI